MPKARTKGDLLKAVIYARLSPTSKKMTDSGFHVSIERQLEKNKKAIQLNEDTLVKTYIDEYRTGKSHEYMKEFENMMNDADTYDIIYCLKVDRFGRNYEDGIIALQKLTKQNKIIFFVQEGARTDNPHGRLVLHILLSVAEWNREDILRKTKEGFEKAKEEGRIGRPKKEIDRKELKKLLESGLPKKRIAKLLDVSSTRLYEEINEIKEVRYK